MTRLMCLLAVVLCCMLPGSGGAQPAGPAAEAETAGRLLEQGDLNGAWEAILRMDASDASAWETNRDIVGRVLQALNEELSRAAARQDHERVVTLAELLRREQSAEFVRKAYPDAFQRWSEDLRTYLGTAYWQLGQGAVLRGSRVQGEDFYRQALDHIRPGDSRYARINYQLAELLHERGASLWERGRPDEGRSFWVQAAPYYLEARDHGADDPVVRRNATDRINYYVLLNAQGQMPRVTGMPSPTPAPTPTPEPGFTDRVFGSEFAGRMRDWWNSFAGGDRTGQLLAWAIIIVGVAIVYWAIPLFLLGYFEGKGDIIASECRRKVRYLGILMLPVYTVRRWKARRQRLVSQEKHGCPHCRFPLDNMFAYEDLVFSRCPKCGGKVTPLYSVEAYVTQLANSLAADAEKVNIGVMGVEEVVKKDAVVRMIRALVTLGVRRRASDLHIEPDERGLVVRQRIDGIMTEMFNLPRSLSLAIVSAVKVSANMNIAEKRIPQDGKFQMHIDKTDIDVRAASSPTTVGEKISLRILDIRSIQMSPKHLGMSPEASQMFDRVIHQPHGMVLITGPTGSGKTTTIYVAIQQLSGGDKNIISIEDPIEFRIPGVNQMQVNPVAGLTFASGLRSILRQDPDVIVVGEIRDHETADISVNAVQTGHLVFSTLHTVDAASSVARLLDLGVSPRQFADALSLIIAQRLVRLVCQYCKEPYTPDEAVLREIGINGPYDQFDFQAGVGCPTCNSTGYYRRTGLFELLVPSERMRVEMENASLSTGQIRELAMQGGMRTLRHEAIALLKQGRTTADECLRVTK